MFLVQYKVPGMDQYGWNLVKVGVDNTDQERALQLGE